MNTYILRENHTHYLPRTQPTLSLFNIKLSSKITFQSWYIFFIFSLEMMFGDIMQILYSLIKFLIFCTKKGGKKLCRDYARIETIED